MGGPPHLPCCCSGQPLVCSISCQRIICRRSPNRGPILDKLNACWIFSLPQAVADPLKMACSMLPGVGDVCVCQDQVSALSTKRMKTTNCVQFKFWGPKWVGEFISLVPYPPASGLRNQTNILQVTPHDNVIYRFIQDLCNGSIPTAASSLLATLLLFVVAQIA